MLFANMFGCVAIIGFSSCFLTIVAGSLDREIVDCVLVNIEPFKSELVPEYYASILPLIPKPDKAFDPITQEACRAHCLQTYPEQVFYAVVVTGSTPGNCFCFAESSSLFSCGTDRTCNSTCPDQPTEHCGSSDAVCASLFKYSAYVPPNEREECGYKGITRDLCLKNAGCSWDDTVKGVIWCYYKASSD